MIGIGIGISLSRRAAVSVPAVTFDYAAFLSGKTGAAYDVSRTSTLYSDTAGTTPAVVGGLVGKILDLSGNNIHLVAFSNALSGTLRSSGGKYWIEGPFCYQAAGLTLGSPDTATTPWQRMTAMKQKSWTTGRRIWAAKTAGTGGFLYQNGTTPSIANYDNGSNNALINPGMALNVAAIIEEYHAGNVNSYNKVATNANFTTGVGFIGTALTTGLSLGGDPDGTANADMDFFGAVVCNGTWTAAEKAALYAQQLTLLTPIPAVTDQASLIAAVAMSPSGTTISVPAGEYGPLDLGSGASRNRTATITIAAADTNNKPTFTGTANTSGLKINSWNGLTLDGLIIKHDEVGLTANPVYVLDADSTTNCTVKNCWIRGNTASSTHIGSGSSNLRGLGLQNSSGATVIQNKFSHTVSGIWGSPSTGVTVRNNYFTNLQEDAINPSQGAATWTIEQNLGDNFTPRYDSGSGTYPDHTDFIQAFMSGGTIDALTIQDNMVRFHTDFQRGQGIYLDNEAVSGLGMTNIVVKRNVIMGAAANSINFSACTGSGNLAEANEVYLQSGSAEVTVANLNFSGTTATYKNNKATITSSTSALTNADTGSQGPTTTLTTLQMQAKVDAFRLTYPLIPS